MAKFTVEDFWKSKRRRAALTSLAKLYKLKPIEIICLRYAIAELPYETTLPESIVLFLEALAADARLYFEHNCPTDGRDPSVSQFTRVLEDQLRCARHEALWEEVRARSPYALPAEPTVTVVTDLGGRAQA